MISKGQTMNIFLYAQEGVDNPVLDTLIGEDEATFYVRENAVLDKAMEFGEVYPATWNPETLSMTTDLGHPGSVITITFPMGTEIKVACAAMQKAVGELI